MCELDRTDPNFETREKLIAKNEQIMKNLASVEEKYLIKYVQMVKNTYQPGQMYQYRMSIPLATLAGFYRMHGDAKKAAETFMQMFYLLKDCDRMFSCMLLVQTVNSYVACGLKREAREVLKKAKEYFVGSTDYYNYVYDINDFRLAC